MEILRSIRRFVQRGRSGYSQDDLWNLDSYLAGVIYNSIRDFRKMERSGYPGKLDNEERWGKILEKIEMGIAVGQRIAEKDYFYAKENLNEDGKVESYSYEFDKEQMDKDIRQYKKSWRLLSEWIVGLWD